MATADFFISYTSVDEAWATWVAEQLEAAGQSVRIQAWDSPPGENFVVWISEQMALADRTIAICSDAYFQSHWPTQEWTGALARRTLLPLRVADCTLPHVAGTITYKDLFDVDEDTARQRLLEATGLAAVARKSGGFPGGKPSPGGSRQASNVPSRNRLFTGRNQHLDRVHEELVDGGPVAVTAVHGLGGVGKTQLAIEYAHRHADAYDVIWWIDAEQSTLIPEQLAGLLGGEASGQVTLDAAEALRRFRDHDRWLLIFDNAENPAAIRSWLPGGKGHVLITSRHHHWSEVAEPIELDVMPRDEAVALLGRRVPGVDSTVADALAAELGDLPLALAQAAGYLGTTGMSPTTYLDRFRTRRTEMLRKGHDGTYGGRIDTAWSLTLEQLGQTDPAAVQLLELCSHLAPEPIPLALFRDHLDLLAEPLAGIAATDDLDDTVGSLLSYSLTRRTDDDLHVHRLVAAVTRAHQTSDTAGATAITTQQLLVAHQPTEQPEDPASWPRWTELLPHVLDAPAIDLNNRTTYGDRDTRSLLITAAKVLRNRGDDTTARNLNTTLHIRLKAALGDDHPDTLASASNLAIDLRALGNTEEAHRLDEDTLSRARRVLGDDHPDTLNSANNLALILHDLGDVEGARRLNEDTLARRRRILGDDHPQTLNSANNLAIILHDLGDVEGARRLNEDTLARRRRVLGDDHPDTLNSANNLAIDLYTLGDTEEAHRLDEDTLSRARRVLGDDHPETLNSASMLAISLRALGDGEGAERLEAEVRDRRDREA